MQIYSFIFSNKPRFRIKRHIAFWLARILFLTTSLCIYIYDPEKSFFANFLTAAKLAPVKVLIADIWYCYVIIYFFIPAYFLKRKYLKFVAGIVLITMLMLTIGFSYNYFYFGLSKLPSDVMPVYIWGNTRDALLLGPPALTLLFLSLKMFKTWYVKEKERQMLLTANASAEILLLKAQVHPHFLFNTLNNIYSFTLSKSPQAEEMVSQLGDMLEYMIHDCEADLVPLDKELKMLTDYIGLEKVRYGNKLVIQVAINGNIQGKYITPLLLIPFVENSFKHGTSQMLDEPWINLSIQADENMLHFILANSRPPANAPTQGRNGIGLSNARKRLQLLYPVEHLLMVESTTNTFTINMQIPLKRIARQGGFTQNTIRA